MDRDFAAFTSANLTEYFGKHFVTASVAKKGYCVHEKGRLFLTRKYINFSFARSDYVKTSFFFNKSPGLSPPL